MKPKKTLHLNHGSDQFELILEWLDQNRAGLSGTRTVGEGSLEIDSTEAQITLSGSEIRLQTKEGIFTGHIAKNSAGLWISLGNQTAFLEQAKRDSGATDAVSAETEIVAPMTGKIVDVRVKPEDKVKQGELLVIMEAMKMEFKLEASMDAIVESVNCAIDELVDLGQLLVKLAPKEAES